MNKHGTFHIKSVKSKWIYHLKINEKPFILSVINVCFICQWYSRPNFDGENHWKINQVNILKLSMINQGAFSYG